jgi:hypothetical protein
VSITDSQYYMYETTALSQTSGIFVSICQDFDTEATQAYVVAGSLSNTTFQVKQGDPSEYTTLYSVNPSITRLDDHTFAISYFTSEGTYEVATRWGTVDADTLAVTLSDSISYASNDDFSMYATITGISASQYLLMYYDAYDASENSYVAAGKLNVIVATVASGTEAPVLGNPVVLEDVLVEVYFQATAISDVTAVVAYSSSTGLRAQAITLDSTTSTVVPGGSWLIASGEVLIALDNSTLSDLDIQSNAGAITAAAGQLTIAGNIVPTTPGFVLSSPAAGAYVWGALSAGDKTPWGAKIAILTSETTVECSDTDAQ